MTFYNNFNLFDSISKGNNKDLPPDVIRGMLWLLLSGFSSQEVLSFFSAYYDSTTFALVSLTLDSGRRLLVIPGLFWTIFSLIRFRKKIFTLEEGLKSKTSEALSADHWYMLRYYEKDNWFDEPKKQGIKHRVGRVLFLLSPIVAIASQCFTFYLSYSVIVASSPTSGTIFPGVSSTIFHWMVKLLLFYNLLSCMPSAATLSALVTLSMNQSISTEAAIWLSACLPFLAFLPIIWYLVTRGRFSTLIREMEDIFHNFLQLCLNFLNPSKIYRAFHILSITFGVCGLLLLLFGLPLSWLTVDFNMDVNLSALKSLHTSLDTKIGSIEATFENILGSLSCVPIGDTIDNQATLDQLKADNPKCFDGSNSTDENCPAIVSAYNNATDTTNYDNSCISDDTVCAAFMAMIIAGFVLAVVPFAGSAGKAMVLAARTMKKMHELMKTLSKVRSKVVTYKKLLSSLASVLQKVTWVVAFVVTSEYLLILLPCVALGAICLSIGFWKRVPIEGLFNRSMLAFISIGFVVTNVPIGLFVWFAAPLLESVLDIAPLFDVTVSDTIFALFSRLFCGCTCCGTCTAKCKRYAKYVDIEKDITNPDGKVNENIEMDDKRVIVDEDADVSDQDGDPDVDDVVRDDDREDLVSNEVVQPIDKIDEDELVTDDVREKVVKTLVTNKIATPSAWFMPLCPALFAGLLVAFVIVFQPPMYVVYTRLNGEVSALEAEISVGSERVADGADTMDGEKTLCDLITAAVTAPFKDLFDALTPDIIPEITTFVAKMKSVFTIPTSVSLSGWAHFIFSGLPGLACFFFILGFLITLLPCCSDFTKSLILGQIKQLILIVVLASLSFSLTAAMAIQRLIENFPLVEITVEYGLAIQLINTAMDALRLSGFSASILLGNLKLSRQTCLIQELNFKRCIRDFTSPRGILHCFKQNIVIIDLQNTIHRRTVIDIGQIKKKHVSGLFEDGESGVTALAIRTWPNLDKKKQLAKGIKHECPFMLIYCLLKKLCIYMSPVKERRCNEKGGKGLRKGPTVIKSPPDADACKLSIKTWMPDADDDDCEQIGCYLELGFQYPVIASRLTVWTTTLGTIEDIVLMYVDGTSQFLGMFPTSCDKPLTIKLSVTERVFTRSRDWKKITSLSKIAKIRIYSTHPAIGVDAVELSTEDSYADCLRCRSRKYKITRDPPFSTGPMKQTSEPSSQHSDVIEGQSYDYSIMVSIGQRESEISPVLHYTHGDPICGDGVLNGDPTEECDDGNVADGDGCSRDCLFEENFRCRACFVCPYILGEPSLCYIHDGDGICEEFEIRTSVKDCGFYTPDGFDDQWALTAVANPDFQDLTCPATNILGIPDPKEICKSFVDPTIFWYPCRHSFQPGNFWVEVYFATAVIATEVIIHLGSVGEMLLGIEDPPFFKVELISVYNTSNVLQPEHVLISCKRNPVHVKVQHDLSKPFSLTHGVRIRFTSYQISIAGVCIRSSRWLDPVTVASCSSDEVYNPRSGLCVLQNCSMQFCGIVSIPHSYSNCSGYREGDVCRITCETGYI
ncbi:hypothetical protein KUTeg_001313 [Tegillarca granosa]|uniref:Pappalysin-1 SD scarf domain-containing protein n=1 Tax=Tegillarca granosa TaxID=220873 RepID=A0ABQ9FVB9_TEGGR|nr:hypothetical protein KUTeg_001313 [Tegillarca granosa]